MRISRMLMPFACLAVAAALMFFAAPSPNLDYGAGVTAASWQAPDLAGLPIFVLIVDKVAPVAERAAIRQPIDAHKAGFIRANRPLAPFRTAADTFRHIDPHIAAG
ncbi:hypothetical protein NKI48_02970 [Mesorhizobium sp. M0644]|uniref:hypothetical protein n=1 Tax=Mesorhizobium sp. M0644 TaxID=2956979 RepID=UPI00333DEC07